MLFAPDYPLEVRPARSEEWYAACMLKRHVVSSNFQFLDRKRRASWMDRYCDEQTMRARWFGEGTDTQLFVALRGPVLQGIGAIRMEEVPRLIDFFVIPRGEGVGSAILQARLAFLQEQGYPSARAELFVANQVVRHLYENHGFERTGEYQCPVAEAPVYHYRGSTDIQNLAEASND